MLVRLKSEIRVGSNVIPAGEVAEVYLVLGWYTGIRKKLRTAYLICWPEFEQWEFLEEKAVELIDEKPSRHWIEVRHKKNQKVYSRAIDEFTELTYAYYYGPELLMTPQENLLRVACGERNVMEEVIWIHRQTNARRKVLCPSMYWGEYSGWKKK